MPLVIGAVFVACIVAAIVFVLPSPSCHDVPVAERPMQVIGGHWVEQRAMTDQPDVRWSYYGGYDSAGHQIVLFSDAGGGRGWGNYLVAYDTEADRWNQLRVSGSKPEAREGSAVMFDPSGRMLIVFGGFSKRDVDLGDTWVYSIDSGRWSMLDASASQPPPDSGVAVAFDEDDRVGYLYGGGEGELWMFDAGSLQWASVRPSGEIPSSGVHEMAFDASADRLLLLSMTDVGIPLETWAYDIADASWTRLTPQPGVAPYSVSSVVYSRIRESADRLRAI